MVHLVDRALSRLAWLCVHAFLVGLSVASLVFVIQGITQSHIGFVFLGIASFFGALNYYFYWHPFKPRNFGMGAALAGSAVLFLALALVFWRHSL